MAQAADSTQNDEQQQDEIKQLNTIHVHIKIIFMNDIVTQRI